MTDFLHVSCKWLWLVLLCGPFRVSVLPLLRFVNSELSNLVTYMRCLTRMGWSSQAIWFECMVSLYLINFSWVRKNEEKAGCNNTTLTNRSWTYEPLKLLSSGPISLWQHFCVSWMWDTEFYPTKTGKNSLYNSDGCVLCLVSDDHDMGYFTWVKNDQLYTRKSC